MYFFGFHSGIEIGLSLLLLTMCAASSCCCAPCSPASTSPAHPPSWWCGRLSEIGHVSTMSSSRSSLGWGAGCGEKVHLTTGAFLQAGEPCRPAGPAAHVLVSPRCVAVLHAAAPRRASPAAAPLAAPRSRGAAGRRRKICTLLLAPRHS